MRALFAAKRVDADETLTTMRDVLAHNGFQIDPHSAIGVAAAKSAVLAQDVPMVTLATAHPAKFPKAVWQAYETEPDTPQRVTDMLDLPEQFTPVSNNLAAVQALIREKARAS